MRFALPLMSLLFTASPSLAAEPTEVPPQAAAPAAAPALRFAWSVPSRVTVTEGLLKNGTRVVCRYDIVLSAHPGGGYEVRREKYQFVEVEGRDVTKGPLPPELKLATAMASAIPTLVLSAEGQVVDVVGMEEAINRTLQLLPNDKGQREKTRAMLAQPAIVQAMKQKAGDFWGVWVGMWVGLDLAADQDRSSTVPVQLPSGSMDSEVTVRNRGPDADHEGSVRLEMETVDEGEDFRQEMVALTAQAIKAAAPSGTEVDVDAMIKSARRVVTVEAVTDAATLRPYSARTVQVTTIQAASKAREDREEHEYSFAWPAKKAGKRR